LSKKGQEEIKDCRKMNSEYLSSQRGWVQNHLLELDRDGTQSPSNGKEEGSKGLALNTVSGRRDEWRGMQVKKQNQAVPVGAWFQMREIKGANEGRRWEV